MTIEHFSIQGPLLIRPKVFYDDRGCFFESFNEQRFEELGLPTVFHQDNQSVSHKGVLRGLHFQSPPWEQGKLVRVTGGRAIDIAVDIRADSPTYGNHIRVELCSESPAFLWIPAGFAHGFLAVEENTVFLYKCTKPYNPAAELGIRWDDPELGIDWGGGRFLISEKDKNLPLLSSLENPF